MTQHSSNQLSLLEDSSNECPSNTASSDTLSSNESLPATRERLIEELDSLHFTLIDGPEFQPSIFRTTSTSRTPGRASSTRATSVLKTTSQTQAPVVDTANTEIATTDALEQLLHELETEQLPKLEAHIHGRQSEQDNLQQTQTNNSIDEN